MANSKQRQWMLQEIQRWQDKSLIDQETADRLQAYYEENPAEQGHSLLSYVLVILGTSLVLLGIILILAKNWSAMPRLARVFCSLLPLLTGIGLGGFSLFKEKDRRWTEASALIMAVGSLTALAINGQIYHVISAPSDLFLASALLSLPLVYLFSAEITVLFYLVMTSIYLGMSAQTLSIGYFFLAGFFLIGLTKPWIFLKLREGRLNSNSFWIFLVIAAAGFVFITSLISYDVPVREVYALYFFELILLDSFLFPPQNALSQNKLPAVNLLTIESPFAAHSLHTLDLLGKLGVYVLIYVLSFQGLWTHISGPDTLRPLPSIILMIFFAGLIGLWFFLFKRDQKLHLLPILLPLLIFVLHACAYYYNAAIFAAFVFNLLFFALGIRYLFQGIRDNNLAIANHGLLFIVVLIATRFLDIDFSFLVRGIVFMLLGIGFLITNLWLVRKKKEVPHVQ